MTFSPQNDCIAYSDDKTVTLYPLVEGATKRTLPIAKAVYLAFSPDGSHLAVSTDGGEIQLWRLH